MAWFFTTVLLFCITGTLTDAECHCNTTAACAVFPSTPCSQVGDPDRCQEGWFGSYCQRQNIALRRPVTQSSTYSAIRENIEHSHEARYAVDGIATTDIYSKPLTCAHTLDGDQTWTVYLNNSNTDKIQHIKLYQREDRLDRHKGMKIYVGGQLCFQWSNDTHPPAVAEVKCQQALTGNNLTIQTNSFLQLCEVQIFVCTDGWFGEDCDKQCHCSLNTEVCDKITGQCQCGCAPGYIGAVCQTECVDGMYGVDCMSRCGQCKDGLACDKISGKCPGRCQVNFIEPLCQGYSNEVLVVPVTLGTLLVLALIALLTTIIYIRRLKIQLSASQKKLEYNYLSLSRGPWIPNWRPHMSTLARPYSPYNTGVEVPQGRLRSVQLYNV